MTVRKGKNMEYMIQIYLEITIENPKMTIVSETRKIQKVPLTHGNIISLDIKNKIIYALVYHPLYVTIYSYRPKDDLSLLNAPSKLNSQKLFSKLSITLKRI